MPDSVFDEMAATADAQGVTAMLERLVEHLRAEGRPHELFEALLMRSRLRLGLPVVLGGSLEDLDEPLRGQVESAYIEACREVGLLLINAGQLREGWMYLRPVADNAAVAQALANVTPDDDNLSALVEIALYEGVAPAWGYGLVLEHYGTCNAITTFEQALTARPLADQQQAAALLVAHLHRELTANVRADIGKQEGAPPAEASLAQLVAERDWLFGEHNYHIDMTHLASTVRYARVLDDRQALQQALDLTEYGRRLHPQFQPQGEEPFVDMYASHGLFFAALLGERVDEALAYFRAQAEAADEQDPAAVEVYVALLTRLGRHADALEAAARGLSVGVRTSGFAPSLAELARRSGRFDRLHEIARQRNDLVGFVAGLAAQRQSKAEGPMTTGSPTITGQTGTATGGRPKLGA